MKNEEQSDSYFFATRTGNANVPLFATTSTSAFTLRQELPILFLTDVGVAAAVAVCPGESTLLKGCRKLKTAGLTVEKFTSNHADTRVLLLPRFVFDTNSSVCNEPAIFPSPLF